LSPSLKKCTGKENSIFYLSRERAMARPERHDVDYFPFFVKQGKTLTILHNKYGLEGIGFFTNVMRFLAITPDHHYCIKNDSDIIHFMAVVGITDENKAIDMIELMVKTGKLDKDLWENHKVIVCPVFIESVKDAYKRRANDIITLEEIREKYKSQRQGVTVSKTDTETTQNGDSDDSNPQTKPKETKAKKSKKEKSTEEPTQSMKDALVLADLLFNLHKKEVPNYHSGEDIEKIISGWAKDIELLIRRKEKQPETIRQVIEWAKTPGCFWFPNIQSGSKLSKQFETLYSQMITDTNKKGKPAQPHKIAADNIPDEKLDDFF
jgi:hypothetical protein